MKPMLLDCTLRDGAYIVDAMFGGEAIRGIIRALEDAGAEIIECGWLKDAPHRPGSSFYHVPADLEQYLSEKRAGTTYSVMIDWDRYDTDRLPPCDGGSVDAVRVVFPHGKHREGAAVGKKIAEKGYRVLFQAANTLAYTEVELRELAAAANAVLPASLSIVDTFGAMYEEDLERIAEVLDAALLPEIALSFHSHNNQQLSFALAIRFLRLFRDRPRQVIVDASLCGMGRGAGNAATELVASYLNRKCGCRYDLGAVLDAIDRYMTPFQERYRWGYSTPCFLAGLYCSHVNAVSYLLKTHGISSRELQRVLASLDPADRPRYDYALLDRKCREVLGEHRDARLSPAEGRGADGEEGRK